MKKASHMIGIFFVIAFSLSAVTCIVVMINDARHGVKAETIWAKLKMQGETNIQEGQSGLFIHYKGKHYYAWEIPDLRGIDALP